MSLTTEQLKVPRYMVAAPYPQSPFKVGDILMERMAAGSINSPTPMPVWAQPDYSGWKAELIVFSIEQYPTVFKPLHWHERRNMIDMPAYLKCLTTTSEGERGDVILPRYWFNPVITAWCHRCRGGWLTLKHFAPATLAEYETSKQP